MFCKNYKESSEIYPIKFSVEDYPDFGKFVFLTKAEAEAKLKELEQNG